MRVNNSYLYWGVFLLTLGGAIAAVTYIQPEPAAVVDLLRQDGADQVHTWVLDGDEARVRFLGGAGLGPDGGTRDLATGTLPDGSAMARIIDPDAHPDLAGVSGAIGETEDEAVTRLGEATWALRARRSGSRRARCLEGPDRARRRARCARALPRARRPSIRRPYW